MELMPSFEPKSSHIRTVAYEPRLRQLTVEFHNQSSKTFVNVPQTVYDNMRKYRSAGEFFHAVVKRFYKVLENPR